MVEKVAQKSLVSELYYVSCPNYKGERSRIDTDEHGTENFKPDNMDGFPEWLKKQTIDGLLIGKNGVYCKITHGEVEMRKGKFISSERTSNYFKSRCEAIYNRVICIRSMPAERDLPLELTWAIKGMSYKLADPDRDGWIKAFKANKRFL